ncbi:hypothetical protein D1641_09510 [Colidextribacter sp. OB.20]|uniref:hypothetical protein n=1 Tax=Colidextribacter sp. OB.20 TaxID=2304568 RepID=UPI00136D108A|nr:hypothetical protein [Colidextribacter sp. OB.20]NBI10244.1 hypothetical protein [Colidextribacter sp. OB.20]
MLKCKICGLEFQAKSESHYISRDGGRLGLFCSLQSNQEERIYDTFDCPACGCQCVAQERKRNFSPISIIEDEEATEEE